jgi:ABC-type multidrug transport system fused ATPase/permease subunit
MSNLIVNCNNCGENIEIHDGLKFVTCRNCQYPLEVIYTDTSVYTKLKETFDIDYEAPVFKPEFTNKELILLELETLDKKWEIDAQTFKRNGKLPDTNNQSGLKLGIVLAIGIALVLFTIRFPILLVIGLFIILLILASILGGDQRQKEYRKALKKYEETRQALVDKMGIG